MVCIAVDAGKGAQYECANPNCRRRISIGGFNNPLQWLGDELKCPKCGGILTIEVIPDIFQNPYEPRGINHVEIKCVNCGFDKNVEERSLAEEIEKNFNSPNVGGVLKKADLIKKILFLI